MKKYFSFFEKIKTSLMVAYVAYKNPKLFIDHNLKMMSGLLILIFKAAKDNNAKMTKISTVVVPKEKEQEQNESQVITIWIGIGAASSPTKRIKALVAENTELKKLLADSLKTE